MIPEICLCFADADKTVAASIAARLENTAEVRVWQESLRSPIHEAWDRGLGASGILLLLSPESVPSRVDLAHWSELLAHLNSGETPPVVCVELGDCPYPPLLRRRRFFRWSSPTVLRDLQRWAMARHPVPDPPPFVPAAVPGIGNDAPDLWSTLVDSPGVAELEHADGAQHFAHAAAPYFRDVLWVACARRSPACIAGEISASMGVPLDGPEADAFNRAVALARRHRLLLVLAGVEPDFAVHVPEGIGSVLVTRRTELPRAQHEPDDTALFEAMCACVPGAFPLELPAAMAGVPYETAVAAADRLAADGLVSRIDRSGSRLRLRARAHPRKVDAVRGRHAAALRDAFTRWSADPVAATRLVPEVELAIRWAILRDWQLAAQLAQSAGSFLRGVDRRTEAAYLYDLLHSAAKDRGDDTVAELCKWELSWLRGGVEGSLRSVTYRAEQLGFSF